MIGPLHGVRIWLACGVKDLRNGFDGLAAIMQTQLAEHPFFRPTIRLSWPAW